MDEQTFLDESGVTVTSARFVVPAQTYAMSGITSVKSYEEKPSRVGPIVVTVLGLLSAAGGGGLGGIVFAAAGVAWWMLQKSKFHVLLNSASGETKALTSPDSARIGRVVAALNDAIVHRG